MPIPKPEIVVSNLIASSNIYLRVEIEKYVDGEETYYHYCFYYTSLDHRFTFKVYDTPSSYNWPALAKTGGFIGFYHGNGHSTVEIKEDSVVFSSMPSGSGGDTLNENVFDIVSRHLWLQAFEFVSRGIPQ